MGELLVRCRAAGLLVAMAGLTRLVLWLALPHLMPERYAVEPVLSASLAWMLLGAWVWLGATGALMAAEAVATGRSRRSHRFAPRLVRSLVATVCGAGLAAGLAAPAVADPPRRPSAGPVLDGLPLPDRAVGAPEQPVAAAASATVRPGDTLTSIAASHGTDWPTLYRLNRPVVGADPDLIQPGQRLTLPSHLEGADR